MSGLPHGPSQSGSGDEDRGTDSIKRFDAVWTMVEREGGAYAQWSDVERLLDDVDSWEQSFAAIEAKRATAANEHGRLVLERNRKDEVILELVGRWMDDVKSYKKCAANETDPVKRAQYEAAALATLDCRGQLERKMGWKK